ncbi:threonine dehydrogenase-like Zn-dependent dehydrogenase [Bradyrhizobium sp. USDA 4516]
MVSDAVRTDVTGRAAVLTEFGKDVAIKTFVVPAPPVNGAIVEILYAGICGTDLHLQQGHLPIITPLVLGHEGLGRIHRIHQSLKTDSKGTQIRSGDLVMWASSISCGHCEACSIWREPTLCDHRKTYGINRSTATDEPLSGAWADFICLQSGTTIVRIPEGTDEIAAMALACAGPTMVHAFQRRPVRLGETVIVQGAGPVGLAAAAIAKLAGAGQLILVGAPASRLRLASECGLADLCIDIVGRPIETALSEVLSFTPKRKGADLVIECTGVPAAVSQGVNLARRGGSYLVVGQYTDSGNTDLNPHQIVRRQLDVVGSWAFSGEHLMRYVDMLPRLTAAFPLARLVKLFDLADVNCAMQAVAAGTVVKAVLKCGTFCR